MSRCGCPKAVESCGYWGSCGYWQSCGIKGARVLFCQSLYPGAKLYPYARLWTIAWFNSVACFLGSRSLSSLWRLSLFPCCHSSCISWIFRTSSSKRTAIYLTFSVAIILNSMASFSLLNIRVLGSSAIAPVFSIICLWYLIGSPYINHHPFSCLVRFPTATALTEMVVKSCI